MTPLPIHPFPARMAPEIVEQYLQKHDNGGHVLDPMCGSGTVLRASVEAGLQCTGIDIDPLSVLMSRVWVTPCDVDVLVAQAECLVKKAKDLDEDQIIYISDVETKEFVEFWFAPLQRDQLYRIATVLRKYKGNQKDALTVSLSRIIITKEMQASLARDTSHSRPHRVAVENDYDVYKGFLNSVYHVANRLAPTLVTGEASVIIGDARNIDEFEDGYFDLAITSPPYLNAIDYLRGHKLTLVWLGHLSAEIRRIRSRSIGAERILKKTKMEIEVSKYIVKNQNAGITERQVGWVRRYAADMTAVLSELARVVKHDGVVVMIVGDSFLRGAVVENSAMIQRIAEESELVVEKTIVRSIPARRRYLPPPGDGQGRLDTRMRRETILELRVR